MNDLVSTARLLAWAAVGAVLAVPVSAAAPAGRVFRAGTSIVDVTPPIGTRINGNFWPITSTTVHDSLNVRCLVLDDGATKLAFAVVDNCLIPREVFDKARELIGADGTVPPECVMMSATHTHSGGAVVDCYLTDAETAYRDRLPAAIATAVKSAAARLEPARIGCGRTDVPEQVFCRRWILKPEAMPENPFGRRDDQVKMNPTANSPDLVKAAGPTDPEVSFLSVRNIDDQPLAVLANYSLHYVGDVGAGHLSADYFGVFAARLGEKLGAGPKFVGVMTNGTSGSSNNINFQGVESRPFGNYQRINLVGERLASAVADALKSVTHQPWVRLDHAHRELTLGVRKPTPNEIAEAKMLAGDRPPAFFKNLREVYARESLLLAAWPDSIRQWVQVFRIGDAAIGGISNEVFAETGLALKKASPIQPYFTVSLANGWNGYLPTPEQHALGGYETWRSRVSCLAVDAEPKIRAALIDLLGTLKAREPKPEQ